MLTYRARSRIVAVAHGCGPWLRRGGALKACGCVHAQERQQCQGVCVRLRICWDQARTGSWMWVNCDLAISLPGGDKSSPCWCVNRSVITSVCHDCLRMQASENLHCRSFSLAQQETKQHLPAQFQRVKVEGFILHLPFFNI